MRRRTLLLLVILGGILYTAFKQNHPHVAGFDIYFSDVQMIDLHIPDTVTSHISPQHTLVPATSLSMIVPEGYWERADMHSYRDADTSITVHEDIGVPLEARRSMVNDYMSDAQRHDGSNYRVSYLKDFKFNGYDAYMVCVSDTTNSRSVICMTFGDSRFSVSMTGTLTDDTDAKRQEVINTMLTACYPRV